MIYQIGIFTGQNRNCMAVVLTLNENLEQIIIEAERLDDLEQKEILAYMRTLNLKKKKKKPISKPDKGL